jgi:predicted transcriptional regulator
MMIPLSRRERQIMEILHRLGRAAAAEVRAAMPDPPSYSAVRATLRILEEKGAAGHEESGGAYVYFPAETKEKARRTALRNLVETFFGGSPGRAAAALLGHAHHKLTGEDLDRLAALIEKARKEGEGK